MSMIFKNAFLPSSMHRIIFLKEVGDMGILSYFKVVKMFYNFSNVQSLINLHVTLKLFIMEVSNKYISKRIVE